MFYIYLSIEYLRMKLKDLSHFNSILPIDLPILTSPSYRMISEADNV